MVESRYTLVKNQKGKNEKNKKEASKIMYTLKSVAQRSAAFGTAFALVVTAAFPSGVVFADELNPLTERSLLLSSSAPGYKNSDGSGNSATNLNAIGEYYSPPGSGPNGTKTGQTFTFRVSSDSTTTAIKAMTFQYCTDAAGNCQAPGDNAGDARVPDRETNAVGHPNETSDLDVVFDNPAPGINETGDFEVLVNGGDESADWVATASNEEDDAHSEALTGKNNFITLTNVNGINPAPNDLITVKFKASETNYITNPGSGSFFVKINTYSDDNTSGTALLPDTDANIIDGGVTVANVMTDSIHITTKVLETMSFSVGTRNRDTVVVACGVGTPGVPEGCEDENAVHGTCSPIQQINNNQLNLGDPNAEYSLETDKAWDVHSYWRLSSNSSGGATVYYSGDTLRNTVGDHIEAIGATKATSTPGTEQFGLGFVDAGALSENFDPAFTALVDAPDDNYRLPGLYTLGMDAQYNTAEGEIGELGTPGTAQFAFQEESNTSPVAIASDDDEVISCSTAKMRYVANIGADTPAGVYTTKINYLAAPQY